MKCKKILSALLACSMVAAMSVSAFAADTTLDDAAKFASGAEFTGEGVTSVPTLKVTVPGDGKVVINPYKMKVKESGDDAGDVDATTGKADQVLFAPQYIESETNVPVEVFAVATGEASEGVKLATASLASAKAGADKSVFLYLEAMETTAKGTPPTWAAKYDSKKHLVIAAAPAASAKAPTPKSIGTIAAGATGSAKVMAFHVAGDAVSVPATAWTEADTVDVKITFTFTPQIASTTAA